VHAPRARLRQRREIERANLVTARLVELPALAAGRDLGFVETHDLGESLEPGKERGWQRIEIDEHCGGALVVEDMVDDDRRFGGERASKLAMRQEPGGRP